MSGPGRIVIIGGGAAGLSAAIAAAREAGAGDERQVIITVLDANDVPGKKLLSTGNGRCNLSNRVQKRECYRSGNGLLPERFYQDGWDLEIEEFMRSVGVLLHERRDGYLYPRTDQASTVQQGLIREAQRLGIGLCCSVRVTRCRSVKSGFELETQGRGRVSADRIVLAAGGMVSKTYGCRGDGYRLLPLRHRENPPVPALCALRSDDPHLKLASGVRTSASLTLFLDSEPIASAQGELQMTDEGISGIPAFQISRYVSRAIERQKSMNNMDHMLSDPFVKIDFLPEISREDWEKECSRRLRSIHPSDTLGDFCRGLVPDRAAAWILAGFGLVREKKLANLNGPETCLSAASSEPVPAVLPEILRQMRGRTIRIIGMESFDKAQVTAGGIAMEEIKDTMESARCPGCFLAGELLDVDGMCGGYNLSWAFHSGLLAGRSAVRSLSGRDWQESMQSVPGFIKGNHD